MDIIGKILDDVLPALPAPPWMGPPLPIAWGVRWQAKKGLEVKPEEDYTIWSGLFPKKYVTRVTVSKIGKKAK